MREKGENADLSFTKSTSHDSLSALIFLFSSNLSSCVGPVHVSVFAHECLACLFLFGFCNFCCALTFD